MLTVGSLFSGIGGLELGLEMTGGFKTVWQVEIDDYATRVLERHWPGVARYRDVRECHGAHSALADANGSRCKNGQIQEQSAERGVNALGDSSTGGRAWYLPYVDLICGGFPCQPHSVAGKRKASSDERDLWGEFYRIICEVRPRWVLAENVPGLLSSEDGRFFGRVLRDLARAGYDAEWGVLSAAAVGAPHLRKRVFIVAHRNLGPASQRGQRAFAQSQGAVRRDERGGGDGNARQVTDGGAGEGSEATRNNNCRMGCGGQTYRTAGRRKQDWEARPNADVAHADITGCEERCRPFAMGEEQRPAERGGQEMADARCNGMALNGQQGQGEGECRERGAVPPDDSRELWAVEPDVGCGPDGLSPRLGGPWGPGWEDGIPRVAVGVKDRVNKLRCLGNAVLPQCAYVIGRMILEAEHD